LVSVQLDWSLLVTGAHGPDTEVFRIINVICGHMFDASSSGL